MILDTCGPYPPERLPFSVMLCLDLGATKLTSLSSATKLLNNNYEKIMIYSFNEKACCTPIIQSKDLEFLVTSDAARL